MPGPRTQTATVFLWTSTPAHRSRTCSIAAPPRESASGARRSIRVTILLGVLEGTHAGYRKLPRQFIRGLAVPIRPADVVRALDAQLVSADFMMWGGPKGHACLSRLCSPGIPGPAAPWITAPAPRLHQRRRAEEEDPPDGARTPLGLPHCGSDRRQTLPAVPASRADRPPAGRGVRPPGGDLD